MKIIEKILRRPEFVEKPPVLVDIGASGEISPHWKEIAPYSICIAFDADERDFSYIKEESGRFKKLYIYNCIVSDQTSESSNFYLTRAPHCSSLLEPNISMIEDLAFASKFQISRVAQMKTVTLPEVLSDLRVEYIDAFKIDSQGMDLRLLKTLKDEIVANMLMVELEPGIFDAYKNEDKVYEVMQFMHSKANCFWLSEITAKGSQKISEKNLSNIFQGRILRALAQFSIKTVPTYCEMIYLNRLNEVSYTTIRQMLLGWILATVQRHHGFALHISIKGYDLFKDNLFLEMQNFSRNSIKMNVVKMKFLPILLQKLTLKNLQIFLRDRKND